MADDSRISPYNLSDCKNTTDDALQNYLTSLPNITQSHTTTDIKLALGYTAVVISAATFALDYKYGWEATKSFTTLAVIVYFSLNAAFTYWIWGVEKGTVFTGNWNGRSLTLSSRTGKYDPNYTLTVKYAKAGSKTGEQEEQLELKAPFMTWFTEDGSFVAKPFQQWLASRVSIIGEADPKNVLEDVPDVAKSQTVGPDGVAGVLNDLNQQAQRAHEKAAKKTS